MSLTASHLARCSCGATLSVFCADSINAVRHPHLRAAVLERALHVFRCEACGAQFVVEKEFVYLDLERRQLYGVFPAASRHDERAHGEALVGTWERALGPAANAVARSLFEGGRFHVRLCYGLEELREKLIIHDAGLSDLVIEALKIGVLAGTPALADAGVIALHLDEARADALVFLAERATTPPALHEAMIVVERARYDALAAEGWSALLARYPGIASGPHVSMLRWTIPGVGGGAEVVDGHPAGTSEVV